MSSQVSQWFQSLGDGIQHNRFLERQVSTGYLGIPVATFGLVTIALAVFVHVTFTDELQSLGTTVYDAASQKWTQAQQTAEQVQEVVSEKTSQLGETINETLTKEGGGRRRRKSRRKRT